MVKTCPGKEMLLALAHDGRFYEHSIATGITRDITDYVCDLLKEPIDKVLSEIYVVSRTFAVRTDNKIVIVSYPSPLMEALSGSSQPATFLFIFKHKIDMISLHPKYGLVRVDGRLGLIGQQPFSRDPTRSLSSPIIEILFDDAKSIAEIICNDHYILLRMIDGRVFACGAAHHIPTDNTDWFRQVQFGKIEFITKIACDNYHTFYITSDGSHYHADVSRHQPHTQGLNPTPTQFLGLDKCFIEDAFMLGHSIAVLHDGGKLSLVGLHSLPPGLSYYGLAIYSRLSGINRCHVIVPVSLPGALGITAVTRSGSHLYITADSTQVYICDIIAKGHVPPGHPGHIDYVIDDKKLRRIEFFDRNPIAAHDGSTQIRSAGNVIKGLVV